MLDVSTKNDILANAKADLSDFRVSTDADGNSLLTVDLIYATKTGGLALKFLLRAGTLSLSSTVANTLYLWWGNPSATAQTGTNAYDADWLIYNPNGGRDTNRVTGSLFGTEAGGISSGGLTGPYGVDTTSTAYDGTDDWIDFGAIPAELLGSNDRTTLCWVNSAAVTVLRNLWTQVGSGGTGSNWIMAINNGSPDQLRLDVSGNARNAITYTGGAWTLASISLAGTTLGDCRFQLDSSFSDVSATTTINNNAGTLYFGYSSVSNKWLGEASELQIHTVERSDAWRLTEFNAGNDPATFASSASLLSFASTPAFWRKGLSVEPSLPVSAPTSTPMEV